MYTYNLDVHLFGAAVLHRLPEACAMSVLLCERRGLVLQWPVNGPELELQHPEAAIVSSCLACRS